MLLSIEENVLFAAFSISAGIPSGPGAALADNMSWFPLQSRSLVVTMQCYEKIVVFHHCLEREVPNIVLCQIKNSSLIFR